MPNAAASPTLSATLRLPERSENKHDRGDEQQQSGADPQPGAPATAADDRA